jgi:hypothetical protein
VPYKTYSKEREAEVKMREWEDVNNEAWDFRRNNPRQN